jgi:hypothetical protein
LAHKKGLPQKDKPVKSGSNFVASHLPAVVAGEMHLWQEVIGAVLPAAAAQTGRIDCSWTQPTSCSKRSQYLM